MDYEGKTKATRTETASNMPCKRYFMKKALS
jgi:hypothetical protein